MPKLVNVKLDLKLPGIGGVAGTWEPHESEVGTAWELYVEMVTRTPLGGFSSQDVNGGGIVCQGGVAVQDKCPAKCSA